MVLEQEVLCSNSYSIYLLLIHGYHKFELKLICRLSHLPSVVCIVSIVGRLSFAWCCLSFSLVITNSKVGLFFVYFKSDLFACCGSNLGCFKISSVGSIIWFCSVQDVLLVLLFSFLFVGGFLLFSTTHYLMSEEQSHQILKLLPINLSSNNSYVSLAQSGKFSWHNQVNILKSSLVVILLCGVLILELLIIWLVAHLSLTHSCMQWKFRILDGSFSFVAGTGTIKLTE